MPFGPDEALGVNAYTAGTHSVTPQSRKARPEQVFNHAGGAVFEASIWTRLERFLVMGITGNTYYSGKQTLFAENRQVLYDCLATDPQRTIDLIVEISEQGRCIRNLSCVFGLSVAASSRDVDVRRYALDRLEKVCRIGTHLFAFDGFTTRKKIGKVIKRPQRGWSTMYRKAMARWYNNHTPESLAFEVAKYQSRDGGDHAHLIRLSHLYGATDAHNAILRWVLNDPEKYPYEIAELPPILRTKIALQQVTTLKDVVTVLRETRAPEEFIPGEWKTHDVVWQEMLKNLGTNAIFRNLCNLAHRGALTAAAVDWLINERLTQQAIVRSRLHPIKVLLGYALYLDGRRKQFGGEIQTWTVNKALKAHLEQCFEWAFKNVQATGLRLYLALDVSGSMGMGSVYEGVNWLTPRAMSAALTSVFLRSEETVVTRGFTTDMVDLGLKRGMGLSQIVQKISALPFGGTDCSLPMLDAIHTKEVFDLFLVVTDNETWAGRVHPFEALQQYRRRVNPKAKLCVLAMTATRFTVADPTDPGMLDICGVDPAIYDLLRNFMLEGTTSDGPKDLSTVPEEDELIEV